MRRCVGPASLNNSIELVWQDLDPRRNRIAKNGKKTGKATLNFDQLKLSINAATTLSKIYAQTIIQNTLLQPQPPLPVSPDGAVEEVGGLCSGWIRCRDLYS